MESAAVLRSFHCSVSTGSHLKSVLERPGTITMNNASLLCPNKLAFYSGKSMSSFTKKRGAILAPCVKVSESTATEKLCGDSNGAISLDDHQNGSVEKKPFQAMFPNGFQELIAEVCDETKIAELKVKFGGFQMHVKRKIEGEPIPAPVSSHTHAPPVQSEPEHESAPDSSPKSSALKIGPFNNLSAKETIVAELEASGQSNLVTVTSTKVGVVKPAKRSFKEGDVIKEGQIFCVVDVFGKRHPIRSDVDGEILKVLYKNGEPVGYGDPLLAVLPSFHDIK